MQPVEQQLVQWTDISASPTRVGLLRSSIDGIYAQGNCPGVTRCP